MADISKITYKGTTYDIYDASAVHSVTPYSLPVATYNTLGGVMPLYSNTGAVSGVTAASGSKTVAVNAISTTSGKYYAVEIDKDGRLYVNVPWAANADQTHSGAWDASNGYKITLSGSNSVVTVPFFVAGTSGGLAKQPASGDTSKFLRGDNTWATPTDNNTTYTLSGAAVSGGYQLTLTAGGSGSGTAGTPTVPVMGAASLGAGGSAGLVPTPASGDQIKFLRGDATWQTIDLSTRAHHIWYLNSISNFSTTTSGQGNWEGTFPASIVIGASSALISIDNYSGDPVVDDTVITKGGFIGYLSSFTSNVWTAKFIGRLDFMAYDHNGTLSANNGTGYDSATSTLILGEY